MYGKNQLNKLRKNYIKIPGELCKLELQAGVLGLYLLLASTSENFHPSVRWLSNNLKLSKGSIRKYLLILQERNIIKKVRIGGVKVTDQYLFNNTKDWKTIV